MLNLRQSVETGASATTAVLVVVLGLTPNLALAWSPIGSRDIPKQMVPHGKDQPGADNGQPTSPSGEVILPPPIGDEDIYTDVPNPNAGHEKEVIPPPASASDKESSASPR